MSHNNRVSAQDQSVLVRLASRLEKGSPERRAILAGLKKISVVNRNNKEEVSRALTGEKEFAGSDLSHVDLRAANFSNANMKGASLVESGLSRVSFSGADLTQAKMTGADIEVADFKGATMVKAYMRDVSAVQADFTKANLSGADLTGAGLQMANFSGANLTNADMSGTIVSGANFTGAKLDGVKMERIQFDDKTKWPSGFTPPKK